MELFKKHHDLAMKRPSLDPKIEYEKIAPRNAKSPSKSKRKMPPLPYPNRGKNNTIFNTPLPKSLKDLDSLNLISPPVALGQAGQSRFHTRHKSVNAVGSLLPKSNRQNSMLSPIDPQR